MSTTATNPIEPDHICHPTAVMPAWWSAFIFHVLNPRQVCMYTYLSMISDERAECSPTIDQIREDLGLYSSSMVFDALSALEDCGFILRERQAYAGVRSRRNRYRRPPCAATILRLLERGRIDAEMCPTNPTRAPASPEARALVIAGMKELLDAAYPEYESASGEEKRSVLIRSLARLLADN